MKTHDEWLEAYRKYKEVNNKEYPAWHKDRWIINEDGRLVLKSRYKPLRAQRIRHMEREYNRRARWMFPLAFALIALPCVLIVVLIVVHNMSLGI